MIVLVDIAERRRGGLDRLAGFRRGTLSADGNSIASASKGAQVFDLDGLGNWRIFKNSATDGNTWDLEQTRTHNAVNELTAFAQGAGQSAWPAPTYDAAGNMLSGPRGDDPNLRIHFKWDAWNRLAAIHADDAGNPGTPGAAIAYYSYDGLNRRIAKITPNSYDEEQQAWLWDRTDYYYNESWQCLEERKAVAQLDSTAEATNPDAQYVWDLRYIDSLAMRDRDLDGDGDLTDFDGEGAERLFFTTDVNFNVTAALNANGAVVERYVYDPYGKPTIYNADWSATVSWANSRKNEILYCGYRFDPESGLYDPRMRPYHPVVGRWLTPEHWLPFADGSNNLQYVRSRPTRYVDPAGLASWDVDKWEQGAGLVIHPWGWGNDYGVGNLVMKNGLWYVKTYWASKPVLLNDIVLWLDAPGHKVVNDFEKWVRGIKDDAFVVRIHWKSTVPSNFGAQSQQIGKLLQDIVDENLNKNSRLIAKAKSKGGTPDRLVSVTLTEGTSPSLGFSGHWNWSPCRYHNDYWIRDSYDVNLTIEAQPQQGVNANAFCSYGGDKVTCYYDVCDSSLYTPKNWAEAVAHEVFNHGITGSVWYFGPHSAGDKSPAYIDNSKIQRDYSGKRVFSPELQDELFDQMDLDQ